MGIETIERHRGVCSKALGGSDSGMDLARLLVDTFVNVDLMGKTDRETVEAVAKHDLVVYLLDMAGIKMGELRLSHNQRNDT